MNEVSRETISAVVQKDKQACNHLFTVYKDFVWALVYRTVHRDVTVAEDVFQEVFVKIFRSLHRFNHKAQLSTWIYRITYTTTMDRLRKEQKKQLRESPLVHDPCDRTDSPHTKEILEDVLTGLSPFDRYLITARELQGMSFAELALITGKTSGALRTRLHRVKEKLKQEYSHERDA
ncbi:RNA polymerase sigma factor [Chitinivibrio alkaliphilus]|uniref:RNA polymerase, sigma-24 subunit, ECF subfamily n=1 Tax=Chitinivibrio alkaliphilus ACht1 TaxID=1313304 RepID=U7D7I0_9BACT|nr:sigma-70 family RNA polymerase sigma factor [Chitinivibrio alkaliphilus]ERP38910.1 RNA polymerase, sigma-24 subunit, ECF subfamily [Chitinivibrio alkaliphilus ACht1]